MPRALLATSVALVAALVVGCGSSSDGAPGPAAEPDASTTDAADATDDGDASSDATIADAPVDATADATPDAQDALDASDASDAPPTPCTPGGDGTYVTAPYATLDAYCLVRIEAGAVTYPSGVVPYDLNTPLFSDYAIKRRAVFVPAGKTATYDAENVFDFPVGTVLVKTFGFPDDARKATPTMRWLETRLLVRAADGWHAYPYLWNDAQTSAKYDPGGRALSVSWTDDAGVVRSNGYLQPAQTQCQQCHQNVGVLLPIGPKARNLNKDFAYGSVTENQLTHWTSAGILAGAPADPTSAPKLASWTDTSRTVDERARAYLEVNCAHCHGPGGNASTSGLFLEASQTDPLRYGVCKEPLSAGGQMGARTWDVVPGDPAASILFFRMQSVDPGIAMPQIGRATVDDAAVQLVSDWITALPKAPCNTP